MCYYSIPALIFSLQIEDLHFFAASSNIQHNEIVQNVISILIKIENIPESILVFLKLINQTQRSLFHKKLKFIYNKIKLNDSFNILLLNFFIKNKIYDINPIKTDSLANILQTTPQTNRYIRQSIKFKHICENNDHQINPCKRIKYDSTEDKIKLFENLAKDIQYCFEEDDLMPNEIQSVLNIIRNLDFVLKKKHNIKI